LAGEGEEGKTYGLRSMVECDSWAEFTAPGPEMPPSNATLDFAFQKEAKKILGLRLYGM
jgi:hypothetical protein